MQRLIGTQIFTTKFVPLLEVKSLIGLLLLRLRSGRERGAGAAAGGGPLPGRGPVQALSVGVWAGADGGDGDPAAGVGARACARGGAGGGDAVRGGQLPRDPGRLRAGGVRGAGCWVKIVTEVAFAGAGLLRRADVRCGCAQRDAAHTMALLQALPSDVVVALFAATWGASVP